MTDIKKEAQLMAIHSILLQWSVYSLSTDEAIIKINRIINKIPWPPPKAKDRQVYLERYWPTWQLEWSVQYGPNEIDRYSDGLTEAEALAQWHRVNILGEVD